MPILEPGTLDFISHSENQTRRLGARLGSLLNAGDVLALIGELGSGKTRWAQGVCEGLAVSDRVISPTFTLVNEYQGSLPVYHIDLYRLTTITETDTFGLDEYLYSHGITLIEWADRATALLPDNYLVVELYHLNDSGHSNQNDSRRRVVLRPHGERFIQLLNTFKKQTFAR